MCARNNSIFVMLPQSTFITTTLNMDLRGLNRNNHCFYVPLCAIMDHSPVAFLAFILLQLMHFYHRYIFSQVVNKDSLDRSWMKNGIRMDGKNTKFMFIELWHLDFRVQTTSPERAILNSYNLNTRLSGFQGDDISSPLIVVTLDYKV